MTNRLRGVVTKPGDVLALALGALLVAAWTWRALQDSSSGDFGLAWTAGDASWLTGHPERLLSWTGTPLLAATMAVLSRVIDAHAGGQLLTLLNLLVFTGAALWLLSELRDRVAVAWWRLLVPALCSFGPLLSTVWFKQFNLLVLVAAAGAFIHLRRGRPGWGAALLGAAVAFKPLVILLPLALLLPRQTRRAGLLSLAWVVGLSALALALLAWRAHDLAVLNPWSAYQNFSHKMDPHRYGYACFPDNFAPSATLCRLAGDQYFRAFQLVALAGVALLASWAADALRGLRGASWELFAFACALSVMVGPVAWSHYQLMLAPLFILAAVRFAQRGAPRSVWIGVGVAWAMVSVDWQPYGTLFDFVGTLVGSGRVSNTHVFLASGLSSTEAVSQFAQYVLLVSLLLWYWRDAPATTERPRAADASAAS